MSDEPIQLDTVVIRSYEVPLRKVPGGPNRMFVQADGTGNVMVYFADGLNEWGKTLDLNEAQYEELRKEAFRKELADMEDMPTYADLYPPPGKGGGGGSTTPNGNTQGRLNGEAPATGKSAEDSNAEVESETPAEDDTGDKILDGLQLGLDAVGLIPVVGEIADLANAGISLARGDYAGAALSLLSAIPFAGWLGTAGKVGRRGAKAAAEASAKATKEAAEHAAREAAEKAAKEKAAKEPAKKKAQDEAAKKGRNSESPSKKQDDKKDGGKSKGDDRDCRPRRYGNGCPGGKTPHHIVPDRVFKMPSGTRIKGGIAHKDGLCICVDGGTPVRKGPKANEHGLIHAIYDPAEALIGKEGTPPGTAPLGLLETQGVMAASAITGCDPKKMLLSVRAYHQSHGLSPTDIFRADPSGRTIKPSALAKIGKGRTPSGMNGL
ncbi:hypothetical protein ACSEQ4_30865 [Pseudomonas aeruginosa]